MTVIRRRLNARGVAILPHQENSLFEFSNTKCRTRVATTDASAPAVADDAQQWSDFSRAVSGEWEGSVCTFTASGVAMELPPLYVPQAFREWGITLYDWQNQTSSIVKDGSLKVSLKKLMPTVGCEADAVAFNEEAGAVFSEAFPKIYLPDGSYTRAASAVTAGAEEVKVEHTMCDGVAETRRRMRMVQVLSGADLGTVRLLEMGEEEWSEPWNGGRELFACGGGSKKISQAKRLEAEALSGTWQVVKASRFDGSKMTPSTSAVSSLPQAVSASTQGLVILPTGAYSYVHKQGADVVVEAGWVLEDGKQRRVSRVVYTAEGKLREAHLGLEARV